MEAGAVGMIKLTINPETEKKIFELNKSEVTISSPEIEGSDIQLNFDSLEDVSLKIQENSGEFFIFNLTNNPFITVDDIPFWKTKIQSHSRIQLGETTIEFNAHAADTSAQKTETLSTPLQLTTPPNLTSQENLENRLEKKIHPEEKKPEEKETEKQTISLFADEGNLNSDFSSNEQNKDDDEIDVQALLKEVEQLSSHPSPSEKIDQKNLERSLQEDQDSYQTPSQEAFETFFSEEIENEEKEPLTKTQTAPSPQNDLKAKQPSNELHPEEKSESASRQFHEWSEFDDNSEETSEASLKKPSLLKRWKVWMSIFLLFATTSIIISKGVYNRLNENAKKTETHAARMISDIALALTYAQINHIKPQQQNWTDPHFLKSSIHSVLSSYQEPVVTIDNHGRLNEGKYLLRIYTNKDASKFLAIAQPEPSLTQWIAPQNAIVLDSQSMKLHRVDDLKPLNRLLVNPNSLSGDSGREVAEMIEKLPIIPLKDLESPHHTYGFAPPKQLELMNLGAENYVYNAPRYSQVGENVMEQAIDLFSRPISSSELKKLQEEINSISKLPNAVLYTSKGMKVALKAQKSLNNFAPDHQFLVAYMKFNPEGKITSTHLIVDSDVQSGSDKSSLKRLVKEDSREIGSYQPLVLAAKAPEYLTPQEVYQKNVTNSFEEDLDPASPLYEELAAVQKSRKEKLEPISEEVVALMRQNTENAVEQFPDKLKKLLINYFDTSEKIENETAQKIKELSRKYSFMPVSQFNKYIKALGLEKLMEAQAISTKEKMKKQSLSSTAKKQSSVKQQFDSIIKEIAAAKNFEELNSATQQSSKLLRLENIPNSTELIEYQNNLRTHVINKLNELIFSSDSELHKEETPSPEGKKLLSKILLHSWIIDPEERNYYIDEYDKLFKKSEWESEWQPDN